MILRISGTVPKDAIFSAHLHGITVDCDMARFDLPCPDIGRFAYIFEPMLIRDGRWVTNDFYFADSVVDCLRKQAAMHRWDCDSRGVAENEARNG